MCTYLYEEPCYKYRAESINHACFRLPKTGDAYAPVPNIESYYKSRKIAQDQAYCDYLNACGSRGSQARYCMSTGPVCIDH